VAAPVGPHSGAVEPPMAAESPMTVEPPMTAKPQTAMKPPMAAQPRAVVKLGLANLVTQAV
jgi:hypothetical protein